MLHGLDDALLDRGDEAPRDRAADDGVLELVALAARQRLDLDPAVAELAAAAGLLLVPALGLRLLADGLAVRHLRRVQVDLDAEPALHLVQDDLDVHLAGARDDHLVGLRVEAQLHGRVFLATAACSALDTFSSSPLALGVMANEMAAGGNS